MPHVPSAGDTSYGSGVIEGDMLRLVYYTSNPKRDYPWIVGMLRSTSLMYTSLDLTALVKTVRVKEE